mgnify:CR=1 FL=1|jgi:ribonuclease-3
MRGEQKLSELEQKLKYRFRNRELLELALTHKSYKGSDRGNNERLEFLGDAVLQIVVSEYLYKEYPDLAEGKLAKLRAVLVSQPTLAEHARELGLNRYLKVGKGEVRSGARERDSLLCDVYEAVIGAVYLDSGSDLETMRPIILSHLPELDKSQLPIIDAKSTLQEHLQQTSQVLPTYHLAEEHGPDHDKKFVIEVLFKNKVLGKGVGSTKKEAAQNAAREALMKLELQD